MTTIHTTETQIVVTGEYNSEFVAKARTLAGKWVAPSWVFDIRDESAVRAACLECYGTDGHRTDLVDVEVRFGPEDDTHTAPIMYCGRTIARAFGRDSGAKLGDGVVLQSGGFTSGGSVKNWYTRAKEGTSVILRDVSRALVVKTGGEYTILTTTPIDRDALLAEKAQLLARLAEIGATLGAE